MSLSKTTQLILGLGLSSLVAVSYANSLFSGSVTVTNPNGSKTTKDLSFNAIIDAVNAFSNGSLEAQFGENAFNDATGISGEMDLRGLPANFSVTNQGKTDEVITIDIPGVIDKTFDGTAAQSADSQLKDWFKGQEGGTIDKVLQAMVAKTAFDPVGGNPASLMAQLVDHAYELGDEAFPTAPMGKNLGFFNLEPHYEDYRVGANTVELLALPITYTRYMNQGKTALILDLPLYVTKTDGSYTYSGALGVGVKQKITNIWSLIPSVYLGGTGSIELGSATLLYNANLKSRLHFHPKPQWYFGVSNMVSYEKTQDLKIGDYNIKYGLSNWAFKNGVDATYLFNNSNFAMRTFVNDTRFTGSKWYIDHYETLGLSLLKKNTASNLLFNQYSIGVSYLFGPHNFDGLNVNATFMF